MTSNSAVPSDEEARAETEAALLAKQDAEDEARYAAALSRPSTRGPRRTPRPRSLRGTPRTRRATPRRSPPSSPRWTRRTASASRAVPISRPQMRPRSSRSSAAGASRTSRRAIGRIRGAMTGPGGRNLRKSWHPGGTDARAELGCTCPPEQLGPTFEARADCPTHGLHTLELPDPSDWVTIRTDDGLEAR